MQGPIRRAPAQDDNGHEDAGNENPQDYDHDAADGDDNEDWGLGNSDADSGDPNNGRDHRERDGDENDDPGNPNNGRDHRERDGDENDDSSHDANNGRDHHERDNNGNEDQAQRRPNSSIQDIDLDELVQIATLPKLVRDLSFIQDLRSASLDDGTGLTGDALHRLRNPPQEELRLDPKTKLALTMFDALEHSSEATYETIRQGIHECQPNMLLPSFYHVKQTVSDFSGVTSIINHMCVDSCAAFVGPYAHLDHCPECSKPRYHETMVDKDGNPVPRAVFHTIPIGPQLQALWRHPESAQKMRYREQRTQVLLEELQEHEGFVKTYDDVLCGSAYLDAVRDGKILSTDTLLVLSIDGAQLYESKESDCWIYIWIILDLSPEFRYKKKHVLPGAIIPGPKKPQFIESFLFPGFHHLSAVQQEGLHIWDASRSRQFVSRLFFFLGCADGPGLISLSNFVGHSGKCGCRLLCPLTGRRKPGGSQYYPVLLKPDNYDVQGCVHEDISPFDFRFTTSAEYIQQLRYVIESRSRAEFASRRLQTGILNESRSSTADE